MCSNHNIQSFADILKKKAASTTVNPNINTSHPNLTSDIQEHNQVLAQTSSHNKIRRKIDKPIKEETNQTSLEKSFSNALKLSASKNAGKIKDRNRGNSLMKGNGYSITWMIHQIFMFSNKINLAAF